MAKVMREKYSESINFIHELTYLKKAASGKYTHVALGKLHIVQVNLIELTK